MPDTARFGAKAHRSRLMLRSIASYSRAVS